MIYFTIALQSYDGELYPEIAVVSIGVRHRKMGVNVIQTLRQLWAEEQGQDVAEYAVMLAVILVIVIGTVRLIGGNANNVFSSVNSQLGQ